MIFVTPGLAGQAFSPQIPQRFLCDRGFVAIAEVFDFGARAWFRICLWQVAVGDVAPDRVASIGAGDIAEATLTVEYRLFAQDDRVWVIEGQAAQLSLDARSTDPEQCFSPQEISLVQIDRPSEPASYGL